MIEFRDGFYADVRTEDRSRTVISYQAGILEEMKSQVERRAFLRVYDGKMWYYASVTDLNHLQKTLDGLYAAAAPNDQILDDPTVRRFERNRDPVLSFADCSVRDIPAKDKQALLRVRSQARLVRELRERLEDTKAAIGAAALDGMPRGKGGLPRGLEMKVMLRETLEESLKREEKRLRDYEKEAREAMIGMKSGAYAFCLYYYICGMNLEDTARITDRCERQIRRYKREIEKEEKAEE